MAVEKEKAAADWFYGKARSAAGYRKNIINNQQRGRDSTVIGKMYFFVYDPKMKKTLPVYDKFPLIFPIERYGDGFLGLNLHYLSQGERSVLLGRLMEYRTSKKLNERSRLRLTYDLISSTKKLASLTRPCIKRYLFDHVRSKFIEVIPDEWEQAINLPVQFFVTKE
jgi:hypothetical protein